MSSASGYTYEGAHQYLLAQGVKIPLTQVRIYGAPRSQQKEKHLTPTRRGARVYFSREELDRFIAEYEVEEEPMGIWRFGQEWSGDINDTLTIEEVAEETGFSVSNIRRLSTTSYRQQHDTGLFPVRELWHKTARYLFSREEIERWKAARKEAGLRGEKVGP